MDHPRNRPPPDGKAPIPAARGWIDVVRLECGHLVSVAEEGDFYPRDERLIILPGLGHRRLH